ncbi:hypothetical protein NEISICOT_02960 [Neisseria sicca ATCC 29256]|uniref:Uncharacterized protein n=1 Tax=Neisseria sicca ATCC 29256 TaxID=547045 RepID=C6M8T5_NEISI|nr:hypothetical protein NEISICOT_02960 [Neisseria sicca ATCC 29256]
MEDGIAHTALGILYFSDNPLPCRSSEKQNTPQVKPCGVFRHHRADLQLMFSTF